MQCTVVAGGEFPNLEWARPRLEASQLIYCADGGLRLVRACGLLPHLLVGDLDSLAESDWADLPAERVRRYPTDKDQSDLELTLHWLSLVWQGPVDILAALGGRLDHALFNLGAVLAGAHSLGLQVRLLDPGREVRWLQGSLMLEGYAGWTCSLLPWGQDLGGLSLRGFRYPLHNEILKARSTRGLSNLIEADHAEIELSSGEGWLILQQST